MTVHPLICYQVCLKIKNGSWTQTQRSNLGKGLHHYFIIIFFLFYHYFFYFTILYWFCHTSTCSRTRVPNPEPPLPPPSPYLPSGSSQCTSPKLPVSCIEPGLAICFLYDIIHVLMPFSQIIPPTHRVQKTVLYICLFCCLTYRVVITIFLNSIYMC